MSTPPDPRPQRPGVIQLGEASSGDLVGFADNGRIEAVTVGSGLNLTDGTLSATGSGGITGGPLTTNVIPKATGATQVDDSNFADNATTASVTVSIEDQSDDYEASPGMLISFTGGYSANAFGPAEGTSGYGSWDFNAYNDNSGDAFDLSFFHFGGEEGAPTETLNNFRLGHLVFYGYDGAATQGGAEIEIVTTQGFSSGSGTSVAIKSGKNNTTGLDNRVFITGDGNTEIQNGSLKVVHQGIVANNPTGGNKGPGTVNVEFYGFYMDGVLLFRPQDTPASAAAAGDTGQMAWDDSYIYVCTAPNTWKRVALATWP